VGVICIREIYLKAVTKICTRKTQYF